MISASIRIAVIGSRPELGSSQKRYFGFNAIALAIATLFFIPPDNSDGNILLAFIMSTLLRQKFTLSVFSSNELSVNISRGNRTFCSTVNESKRALPWKSIPISLLIFFFPAKSSLLNNMSSYQISPLSISCSPTIDLSNTVLPDPLRPIMRLVLPVSNVTEIFSNICFPLKDLFRFIILIMTEEVESVLH